MLKTKLSYRDQSDWVWFMTKTKQGNNVIDSIGMVYDKNITKLSRPIRLGMAYDKTKYNTMWSIFHVRSTLKIKLSYHDQLDRVWSVMKTRQDNDITYRTDVVYAKNDTEF